MKLRLRRSRTIYTCGNCRETFKTAEELRAHQDPVCPLVAITYGRLWPMSERYETRLRERPLLNGHLDTPSGSTVDFTAIVLGLKERDALADAIAALREILDELELEDGLTGSLPNTGRAQKALARLDHTSAPHYPE
jgi:hypothetical protein